MSEILITNLIQKLLVGKYYFNAICTAFEYLQSIKCFFEKIRNLHRTLREVSVQDSYAAVTCLII